MMKSLRSDKIAGILTGIFGLCVACFGGFGLAIVAFQRAIMSSVPPGPAHVEEMMRAVHSTWINFFPFMIAGGVIFGVAGIYVYRGSLIARRISQITAVLGIIWTFAYSIAAYRVMQTMTGLPFTQGPVSQWFLIVVNTIFIIAFPTANGLTRQMVAALIADGLFWRVFGMRSWRRLAEPAEAAVPADGVRLNFHLSRC